MRCGTQKRKMCGNVSVTSSLQQIRYQQNPISKQKTGTLRPNLGFMRHGYILVNLGRSSELPLLCTIQIFVILLRGAYSAI